MTDKQTIGVYDSQIGEYQKLVKSDQPDPNLIEFIGVFSKGDRILDLGCGLAEASYHMIKHGLSVDPVDGSAEMVEHANKTYDVGARQLYFSDLTDIPTYHGVWANFSFLHASPEEFPQLLKKVRALLLDDGYFHIGMKLGSGYKRDNLGRLYAYYGQEELILLLKDAGFSPESITTGEALGLAGDVEPWITILSKAD